MNIRKLKKAYKNYFFTKQLLLIRLEAIEDEEKNIDLYSKRFGIDKETISLALSKSKKEVVERLKKPYPVTKYIRRYKHYRGMLNVKGEFDVTKCRIKTRKEAREFWEKISSNNK